MREPETEGNASPKLHGRLRMAAGFIAAGLVAAALSLCARLPIGLLASMGLAFALSGVGMAIYLYSIVSIPER